MIKENRDNINHNTTLAFQYDFLLVAALT